MQLLEVSREYGRKRRIPSTFHFIEKKVNQYCMEEDGQSSPVDQHKHNRLLISTFTQQQEEGKLKYAKLNSQINREIVKSVCFRKLLAQLRENRAEQCKFGRSSQQKILKKIVQNKMEMVQQKLNSYKAVRSIKKRQADLDQICQKLRSALFTSYKFKSTRIHVSKAAKLLYKLQLLLAQYNAISHTQDNGQQATPVLKTQRSNPTLCLYRKDADLKAIKKDLMLMAKHKFKTKLKVEISPSKFQKNDFKKDLKASKHAEISKFLIEWSMEERNVQHFSELFQLAARFNFKIQFKYLPLYIQKLTYQYLLKASMFIQQDHKLKIFKLKELQDQFLHQIKLLSLNKNELRLNLQAALGASFQQYL